MKRNLLKLLVVVFLPLISCKDEVDVDNLLSFPPAIQESYPFDNGQVVIGDFDVRIVFADGANSPLKSASVVLKDEAGTELIAVNEELSGTVDSVNIDGAEFDASSLGAGDYVMTVTAEDTKGQTQTYDINFSIITSLYPANNDAMYLAGEFNGWGATELELVGPYTWEAKEVNLAGGPFKFKNTPDWSDQDWGDADCDGTAAVTTGGGPNTECGYSGLVNVRFNDQTLKYTITPAVSYATNLSGLYLLGTVNQFSGPPDYGFTLTADNTWELDEIRLKSGDAFKFAETKTFQGDNYGDAEFDGEAELYGPNIVIPNTYADAFYKIVFNDKTLEYTITLVRMPFPAQLYLVGGSTTAGWTPGNSIQFTKTAEGKFEMYAPLTAGGGGFKFLQVKDWAGDWGKGSSAGTIVQEGESNVEVTEDGFYRIVVDFTNMTYSVTKTQWGVIGNATPGGWDNDTNLTYTGGYTWEGDVTLTAGALKFRANDAWDINLGDSGANGSLEYNGADITGPGAGNYHIKLILAPTGYTYTITPN